MYICIKTTVTVNIEMNTIVCIYINRNNNTKTKAEFQWKVHFVIIQFIIEIFFYQNVPWYFLNTCYWIKLVKNQAN